MLIRQAYRLQGAPFAGSGSDSLIVGAPAWVDSDHFDIVAKADASAPANQMSDDDQVAAGRTVQARGAHGDQGAADLCARPGEERRQARVHSFGSRRSIARRSPRHAGAVRRPTVREVREEQQAEKGPTRRPGRSAATCARGAATVRPEDRTGQHDRRRRDARATREHVVAVREPDRPGSDRARAAASISTSSGRRTHRDAARRRRVLRRRRSIPIRRRSSPRVQEQLGLKLESTKGQVDVLVIDHVEPPTED